MHTASTPICKLPQLLSQAGRRRRWFQLGLFAAPLLGAAAYRFDLRVPGLQCPIRALTGIPCPTCGMTRSFVAIAHGDLAEAFIQHLFGPLLFLGLALAVIHVVRELSTNRPLPARHMRLLKQPVVAMGGVALYFAYYGIRLLYWFGSGTGPI